jgi:hypothetical protein
MKRVALATLAALWRPAFPPPTRSWLASSLRPTGPLTTVGVRQRYAVQW